MSDNWHGWIDGVEFTSRESALKALGISEPATDARELDKIVSDIQSVEPGSGGCNDIDHEEARAMIERYVQSRLASAREREGALREALKIIILECCDGQCGTPDIARAALDPREEGPKDGSGKA